MKWHRKLFMLVAAITSLFCLSACSGANITTKKEEGLSFDYGKINVLTSKGDYVEFFTLNNNVLKPLGQMNNVMEFIYNYEKSIYIYLIKVSDGEILPHNKIKIETPKIEQVIDTSYNMSDLKLSPNGNRLVFRRFSKDSYESVEGIVVYDLIKSKEHKLKTNSLISGDMYQWLDDNKLIYYAASSGENKSYGIYCYDLEKDIETPYFNNLEGYCTFLYPLGNKKIVFLEQNINESKLIITDLEKKERKIISQNIFEIYNILWDKELNLLYYTALDQNENKTFIYQCDLNTNRQVRLNYSFPDEISSNGGLVKGDGNIIYFTGTKDGINNIYSYNPKSNAISLITNKNDNYYLSGNHKN